MKNAYFLVLLVGFVTESSFAARTITFYGNGDNVVNHGKFLIAPASSTCKLTIINQSTVNQKYTLTLESTTKATGLSEGAVTVTTPYGITDTYTTPFTNVTINPGVTHNYKVSYPALPSDPAGKKTATGTQHVECNGTVTVEDTEGAGSIGFSGIINTVSEKQKFMGEANNAQEAPSAPSPGFVLLSVNQN